MPQRVIVCVCVCPEEEIPVSGRMRSEEVYPPYRAPPRPARRQPLGRGLVGGVMISGQRPVWVTHAVHLAGVLPEESVEATQFTLC